MSDYSVLHVAAMWRAAQGRYKDKKVVKDSDGKDMTVYEYSDAQVARRNSDKAKRVQKLRDLRSGLIKTVKKDLKSKDEKTRLTALAVALIDHTYERVGNDDSAKDGHFGVTGWLAEHITFSGGKATVKYVGKSGVRQTKDVNDAAAVKLLREITKGKKGKDPVFESITADDINAYLPKGITTKDLRGLHANQEMLTHLKGIRGKGGKLPEDKKARAEKLKSEFDKALDETAKAVGHEPSTLKSQYLVPHLETEYLKDGTVIKKLDKKGTKTKKEKEDEQIRDMLRPEPKKKPPRQDLRKRRVQDEDDEEEKPNADNDKDLSLNYKRVARLFLGRDKAKSEEAAKKLFERYQEENPDTDKTWTDFYEKPEDKEPKEKEPEGEERKPKPEEESSKKEPKPEDEERAREVAHKKLVRDTMKSVGEALKTSVEGAALPAAVRKSVTSALERMDEEQIQEFASGLQEYGHRVKTLPLDGEEAVKKAERALEDLADYDFGGALKADELAQKVVERTHAEAVLKRDKAKQKGKKRKVTDSIDQVQAGIRHLTDDPDYALPSEVKKVLKTQLEKIDEDKFEDFVGSIGTSLQELQSQDLDTASAVSSAQGVLDDFADRVDEMDDLTAKGGEIAEAIHAKRVVQRQEGREKAKKKADKAAIRATAHAFGEKRLPREVEGKLEDALATLDMEGKEKFIEAVHAAHREMKERITTDPETGAQTVPPELIRQAVEALEQEKYEGGPGDIAQAAARAVAAQTLIADPFTLNGQKVGGQLLDDAGTRTRGMQAFDKYRELPLQMQEAAAGRIVERLEELDADTPEAKELNRILDGIALAALSGKRKEGAPLPKIPGREVSEGFAELARAMVQSGKADLLLGPVEDFHSGAGQQAVAAAMDSMEDEELARAVESTMPGMAEYLVGTEDKPPLPAEKREVLRNTLIDMSVDNISVVDRLIRSRLKDQGRPYDPDYVAERTRKLRLSLGKDWWEDLIKKWLKPESSQTIPSVSPSTLRVGSEAVSRVAGAYLAGLNDPVKDPALGMRLEYLTTLSKLLDKEVGKPSKSHADRAFRRFLETKNPKFLRSDPETPEVETESAPEGEKFRLSLDMGHVITAGQPSVRAENPFSIPRRGTPMSTLTREAAAKVTEDLDRIATLFENNHEGLGIPPKIALDFAYRCDLLSDEIDRASRKGQEGQDKEAYQQGTGEGTAPGSDENKNLGPPQPFNPAEIGKQDNTPPETQPDEPYMKNNFLQKEYNELRNWQEKGLFSNAKAASEAAGRMIAKLQGLVAALS